MAEKPESSPAEEKQESDEGLQDKKKPDDGRSVQDADDDLSMEQRIIAESIKLEEERKKKFMEEDELELNRALEEAIKLSMMSAMEEDKSREYNELRSQSEKFADQTFKMEEKVVTVEDTRPLFDRAVAMSEQVQDPKQPKQTIYKLKGRLVGGNDKRQVRRLAYGPHNEGVQEKTILVVGETGSGKSTLIDSMANYIMGAKEPDDPARFRIVDVVADEKKANQTDSQTDWITCYSINKMAGGPVPFNLNLIDTPGFGDTRGMTKDNLIVHQIRYLFETLEDYGMMCLDAVCIVIKTSETRLTPTQRYIFDSLMTLFGKNLGSNILALGTFYDGSNPQGLESLNRDNIPYKEFFTFNNTALNVPTVFTRHYWDPMMENWKKFFDTLDTLPPQSLKLSVEVLQERELLQDTVAILMPQIKEGLHKMSNRKTFMKETQGGSDSTSIAYTSYDRKKAKSAYVNTNCNMCHQTCVRRDVDIKPGMCKLCECASQHMKEQYSWRDEINSKKLTIEELKTKYNTDSIASLRVMLEREYHEIKKKVETNILRAQKINLRLEEIALRPKKQSVVEYVELMIAAEKNDPADGRPERIIELEQLKAQYKKIDAYTNPEFKWNEQECC